MSKNDDLMAQFEQHESLTDVLVMPVESFTTEAHFSAYFEQLSIFLMNRVFLVINGLRHRLTELEFYFTSASHPDPFTHCSEDQRTHGLWYFHRSSPKVYRSGYVPPPLRSLRPLLALPLSAHARRGNSTYKGLDISIGRNEHGVGGILIRTIQQLESAAGKYAGAKTPPVKTICGPCLSVDHILKLTGAATIADLVTATMKGNISVDGGESKALYLAKDTESLLVRPNRSLTDSLTESLTRGTWK